jgi:hypothetical protein
MSPLPSFKSESDGMSEDADMNEAESSDKPAVFSNHQNFP